MASRQEERDLVARAQAGDRSAFDALALEHREEVERALSREAGTLLKAKVEIEDLVQETYLRAFKSLDQYRDQGEGSFKGWLLAIARHTVGDKARLIHREKRALSREVPLGGSPGWGEETSAAADPGIPSPDSSPSKGPRREERFERLKEALSTLSPEYQEVIRLARLEGLPIGEVALRMGRSKSAASMLLMRAMQKLRAAFGSTESFHLPPRNLAMEAEAVKEGEGVGQGLVTQDAELRQEVKAAEGQKGVDKRERTAKGGVEGGAEAKAGPAKEGGPSSDRRAERTGGPGDGRRR